MRTRDRQAARHIRALRIDRGWTPEALSYEIHRLDPHFAVSGRTIRRVERDGVIPSTRVMFGIALAFGMVPSELWGAASRPVSGAGAR